MLKTESKQIEEFSVEVTSLPALRSMKLLHRLGRALGPALLRSLAGVPLKGKVEIGNIDVASLANGTEVLFDRLSADDLEHAVKELFGTAYLEVDGRKQAFLQAYDLALSGRLDVLGRAFAFALEVNYGNFLGALKALQGAVGAESKSNSANS